MPKLNIVMGGQWRKNWCWAAVSEAMIRHQNPASKLNQCKIAQKVTGESCCDADVSKCDQPRFLDQVFALFDDIPAVEKIRSPIDFASIQAEIAAGRPIPIKIVWDEDFDFQQDSDEGAHFMLIAGWEVRNGVQMVNLLDPMVGHIPKNHWDDPFNAAMIAQMREFHAASNWVPLKKLEENYLNKHGFWAQTFPKK